MKKNDTVSEGVYNADVFKVLADYEISRSRRYPSPLALIAIEVKSVTTHESSRNSASALFLSALGKHLRSVDIPSQMGDTFMALLPTTDANGVRSVCERLLSVFKNKFNAPDGFSVAFSLNIGAASHEGGASLTSDELFANAREALRQSILKGPSTYVVIC